MEDNPFDDLNALREESAAAPASASAPCKPKRVPRPRTDGRFYVIGEDWFEKAVAAVKNKEQLAFAVRLGRRWKWRKTGSEHIVVGNCLIGGNTAWRRKAKQEAIQLLAAAGLLVILPSIGDRQAARVRIVE